MCKPSRRRAGNFASSVAADKILKEEEYMKLFGRFKALAVSTLAVAALAIGLSAAPASAQVSVGIGFGVPAPVYYNTAPGCPVSPYDLQDVLSGMYGVDGLGRPVNAYGFPVDVYGNCLTGAPVVEIFNYQPAGVYLDFLWTRYHYRWSYRPGFVHLYSGPGVAVYHNYGAVPAGHTRVIIQQNYHAPVRTVTPTGPATTVRPGQYAPPPAATAPGVVTPPRAAGPTATFNRPGAIGEPPAIHSSPTMVTPPRAAAPTRTFNRPRH
jgi:hypothetical protein